MSYKEVLNKGLKRAYEFTIASADFNTKLESKIEEVKKSVKIDALDQVKFQIILLCKNMVMRLTMKF